MNHEPSPGRVTDKARVEHPFTCGFDPRKHNFKQYVFHIEDCQFRDCKRRWENHQQLRRELCGERTTENKNAAD